MKYLNLNSENFYSDRFAERFDSPTDYSPELSELVSDVIENPDRFSSDRFKDFSLGEIYNYILYSHRYYKQQWLPKIDNTLDQFSRNKNVYAIIRYFFKQFKEELLLHIDLEEKILMPIAENQIFGESNLKEAEQLLLDFLNTHNDNIILDLDKIFAEFESYDPSIISDLTYRIFKTQFRFLQNDLLTHSFIEDEVFVTKVIAKIPSERLENSNKKSQA